MNVTKNVLPSQVVDSPSSKERQIVRFTYTNPHFQSQSALQYRDFGYKNISKVDNKIIRIKQKQKCGYSNDIACRIWNASILMSDYLDYNWESLIKDKIVLELGSGLGLSSIVCSFLSARKIFLTDINDKCLTMAKENIITNKNLKYKSEDRATDIHVCRYEWGNELQLRNIFKLLNSENNKNMKENKIDIVLGADIIYLRNTYQMLYESLCSIADHNSKVMIVLVYAERFAHQQIFYKMVRKRFHLHFVDGMNEYKMNLWIVTKY